jgi:amidase
MNPTFNAVVELNPDAYAIARELDDERREGRIRGYVWPFSIIAKAKGSGIYRPLHGLPILIKGNIGTRDKMQTNGKLYIMVNSVL